MRGILKVFGGLLALVLIYVVGLLVFGSLTDWQPTGERAVAVQGPGAGQTAPVIQDSLIRLLTWNVGYGGIGDEDFFFYNQKNGFWWTRPGTVRMSEDRVRGNVLGQQITLKSLPADFYLLQEIDTAARRSHYTNQYANARAARPAYAAAFAANYVSRHVPLPLLQPWDHYGAVTGGLVSLTRYRPQTSVRQQLPGEYGWPTRLFQLDRCALRQTFAVAGGRTLVVYNVHLSAYDKDGSIRRQQMAFLRERVLEDYAAGHYVVVGGDWNQMPPGFNWFGLNPTVGRLRADELPYRIDYDFMPPGWQYAFVGDVATNRSSAAPYVKDKTRTTVIDFFLVSPNMLIRSVQGIRQQFRYSDHQPVYTVLEFD